MEVPRLGDDSELQLLAYSTATATPDLSHVCDLYHSSPQCWTLNPMSEARDQTHIFMDTSQVRYHWATIGTPQSRHFRNKWVVNSVSFVRSFSSRNPYWKVTIVNYLVKHWKIKKISVTSSQNIWSCAVYGQANKQIVSASEKTVHHLTHPCVCAQAYVIA